MNDDVANGAFQQGGGRIFVHRGAKLRIPPIGTAAADRLIFNSDQSGNLQYLTFAGYAAGATQYDLGNGYFEVAPAVVPVPEPATVLAGLFLLLVIGYSERRRCLSVACWLRARAG